MKVNKYHLKGWWHNGLYNNPPSRVWTLVEVKEWRVKLTIWMDVMRSRNVNVHLVLVEMCVPLLIFMASMLLFLLPDIFQYSWPEGCWVFFPISHLYIIQNVCGNALVFSRGLVYCYDQSYDFTTSDFYVGRYFGVMHHRWTRQLSAIFSCL